MGRWMDSKRRIELVAQWWTQATNEQRQMFVQRFVVNAAQVKNKNAPTHEEIQLAILLSEAEQGTVDGDASKAARALGERISSG